MANTPTGPEISALLDSARLQLGEAQTAMLRSSEEGAHLLQDVLVAISSILVRLEQRTRTPAPTDAVDLLRDARESLLRLSSDTDLVDAIDAYLRRTAQ